MSEVRIRVANVSWEGNPIFDDLGWAVHTNDGEWYVVEWDDGVEDLSGNLWQLEEGPKTFNRDAVLIVKDVNGL